MERQSEPDSLRVDAHEGYSPNENHVRFDFESHRRPREQEFRISSKQNDVMYFRIPTPKHPVDQAVFAYRPSVIHGPIGCPSALEATDDLTESL
jgi:hypothetical protein